MTISNCDSVCNKRKKKRERIHTLDYERMTIKWFKLFDKNPVAAIPYLRDSIFCLYCINIYTFFLFVSFNPLEETFDNSFRLFSLPYKLGGFFLYIHLIIFFFSSFISPFPSFHFYLIPIFFLFFLLFLVHLLSSCTFTVY